MPYSMLKKPMTNSRMDANRTIPAPRPSAWRPAVPLSRFIVAEVMVTSYARIAGPLPPVLSLSARRPGGRSGASTERVPDLTFWAVTPREVSIQGQRS